MPTLYSAASKVQLDKLYKARTHSYYRAIAIVSNLRGWGWGGGKLHSIMPNKTDLSKGFQQGSQ